MSDVLKREAYRIMTAARRDGQLLPPDRCEACGKNAEARRKGYRDVVWHHWDYTKPLDVIPLCRRCHGLVHEGSMPEPRTGRMYPRVTRPKPVWLHQSRP